jgi:hypothetical protein
VQPRPAERPQLLQQLIASEEERTLVERIVAGRRNLRVAF